MSLEDLLQSKDSLSPSQHKSVITKRISALNHVSLSSSKNSSARMGNRLSQASVMSNSKIQGFNHTAVTPQLYVGADKADTSSLANINEKLPHSLLHCKESGRVVFNMEKYFPKCHKAKVVVWADLTVDAVDRLNESLNADHVKQVLADIFELDNYKDNLKTGIKMDLYYYTLQFAREQDFSPEKTSAFFSIIKKIFEVCIETPYGNLDHTFKYFKDLILCHSVNRPPYSIELFSADEVRKISEYTINTFFRHFKMYKYAFTPMVRLDLQINYLGMPPSPPPSDLEPKEEVPEPEDKGDEIDEEALAAREELKGMVREFLATESKRIEGNVENHIKSAVASLNTQIDSMLDVAPEKTKKKK